MPFLSAFVLAILGIVLANRLAPVLGLLDRPGGHKLHQGAVPLTGGIGMFLAWAGAGYLHLGMEGFFGVFLLALLPVFITGLLDDRLALAAAPKFAGQILTALLVIYLGGQSLQDLGNLFGFGTIALERSGAIFTLFCIVGLINAFNFADGVDGLAGGLSFVALFYFAVCALLAGLDGMLAVILVLLGAVAGFLVFNHRYFARRGASVFMGDSGSMLLGAAIVWFAIDLSQPPLAAVPPAAMLWFVALPLLDTVSLVIRRLVKGRSPFKPGRDHLHHILLRLGFDDLQVSLLVMSLAFLLGGVGLVGWRLGLPDYLLIYMFLALFALYTFLVVHAWRFMRLLRRWEWTAPGGR